MNGDGGVNHLNYVEPSGWYQTAEHLLLAPVSVGAGQAVTDMDIKLLSPTPYPEENRSVTRGQGGGTLKNNDCEVDLRKVTVNSLLIIAHEPAAGSGTKEIVSIDWPGFVGTFHAMNEDGLILVTHSSPSIPNWNATNMLDCALLYRETLQQCSTITEVKNFWESAAITRAGGLNTAVSVPYQPGQEGFPSVTYETDSYGGVMREPEYIDPADPYCILTTNNFFKYTGVNPEAVSKVHGYYPEIMPDNYRYKAMMERLDQFRDEGRTVGTTEMIELLRAASTSEEYSGVTEFSFIGYPNKMSFALAREDLDRKILDASYAEFTEFSFDEVFQ